MQRFQPFIIFGTRNRRKTLGKGEFYCPNCEANRRYERLSAQNHFSLYFVPLIPMGDAKEFVQCQTCDMAFAPEVLGAKPKKRPLSLAQQLNTLRERAEDGQPIEYIVRDLTAAGLDRDVAQNTVTQQIGEARRQCPTCNLTYAPTVTTCAEDGTALA